MKKMMMRFMDNHSKIFELALIGIVISLSFFAGTYSRGDRFIIGDIYLNFSGYEKQFYLDNWTYDFSDYCPVGDKICSGWAEYRTAHMVINKGDTIDWLYKVCVHERCHSYVNQFGALSREEEEVFCAKVGDQLFDEDCFKLFTYIILNSDIELKED